MNKIKVLIADDDDICREKAERLCYELGANTVVSAVNGYTLVEKFRYSELYEFNLIITDMQMPVMNGLKAVRAIRNMDRDDAGSVMIIMMSSADGPDDDILLSKYGLDGFLSKPIDKQELADFWLELMI